jgi:hypothetical protein
MPARPHLPTPAVAAGQKPNRRWLVLVHQLPATPSKLRVRTWRRLQQIGALPLKQAVYVLPDSSDAREDLEWLKTEIVAAGGEASILEANHLDNAADDELVEASSGLARKTTRPWRTISKPHSSEPSAGVSPAAGGRRRCAG